MKKTLKYSGVALLAATLIGVSQFQACSSDPDPVQNGYVEVKDPVVLNTPINQKQYIIGDQMAVGITVNTPEEASEITLWLNDKILQENISGETQTLNFSTTDFKVGYSNLKLSYKDKTGTLVEDTRQIIFFSDIDPQKNTIVKIEALPHDKSSYTQGLEFYKGELYEGTGHYNKSILAKVDLKSGGHLNKVDLESKYFGEGITILNDTIFQITWNERTCLLYDMEFNKIGQFSYDGEGWGLTNDGEHIIMTNGSSEIVWRDPATFEVVKTIHAFDNNKEQVNLNECELINGRLLINIYTETNIVEVDTATGKVLRTIDCSSLKAEQPAGVDHLNGIAYNDATGKLYLTGKWWPNLYEVEIDGWDEWQVKVVD